MWPHDEYFQELDAHNAPTEPLNTFHLPSNLAGISAGEPFVFDEPVPAPIPYERPFPALGNATANPYPGSPAIPVYPVLPPLPSSAKNKKRRRPTGGTSPAYPFVPSKPMQQARTNPTFIPLFVGIFFVALQLLLLVRFALKFLDLRGLNGSVPWVALIYAVSNLFVLPFRLILHNISLPIPTSLELYTLLAILAYGLLSRILVRVLKAILR